ncbi:nitrous oxide reductase [Aspergillus pseudoustus]|uniref:Nitrous oxide reductase n=1 Tax=Aspergillus pseudoustus TaxID=1810923 RepID=A0ABR4IUZ3_9EURO
MFLGYLTSILLVSVYSAHAVGAAPAPDSRACSPPDGEAGAAFALTNAPDDNQVIAFSRSATGKLTQTGAYSTGGRGIGVDFDTQGGLQLSPDHKFLYAVSPADDKISVFAVDGSCLERVQVIYAGDQPLAVALKEDGSLAYVLDGSVASTGIFGFHVNSRTGRLTAINNATIPISTPIGVPGAVLFSPDGKSIAVTSKVGSLIDVFSIDDTGLATGPVSTIVSSGLRPFGAVYRDDGTLFVVESGLPVLTNTAVSTYRLDNATSTYLSALTRSEKNQQTDGCWIVLGGEDDEFAFTANFVSGTVSSYAVAVNGTVSLIDGEAAFTGEGSEPVDLAVTPDKAFLYNLLRGDGAIVGWKIEENGTLSSVGTFGAGQSLPKANGASGLAVF